MRVVVDDDRLVVDIRHVGYVHVGHRAVVEEVITAPLAAAKSDAAVAEAVVNAAVETDVRSPVPSVEKIDAALEAPVAGGPKEAGCGRHDPRARNPVIAVVTVSPVAGRPHITRAWA